MNFISKNMLAIALLLSVPAGLLSSQAAPIAKTLTEQVAPHIKKGINNFAEAGDHVVNSECVQQVAKLAKECLGAVSAGIVANAKVILPATIKYGLCTLTGDGSYADLACSATAKVVLGLAVWKGYGAAAKFSTWWNGPSDPRSWTEYLLSPYNAKGKLRKTSTAKVAAVSTIALMAALGVASKVV